MSPGARDGAGGAGDGARDVEHEALLSAYLDGELAPAERRVVEDELAASAELRAVLTDVRLVRDVLRELPVLDASPQVWRAIEAHVRASGSEPRLAAVADVAALRPVPPSRTRRIRPAWLAAGAAAAAALVALFVVPTDGDRDVDPAIDRFADTASARDSFGADPVSELLPVSVDAGVGP